MLFRRLFADLVELDPSRRAEYLLPVRSDEIVHLGRDAPVDRGFRDRGRFVGAGEQMRDAQAGKLVMDPVLVESHHGKIGLRQGVDQDIVALDILSFRTAVEPDLRGRREVPVDVFPGFIVTRQDLP